MYVFFIIILEGNDSNSLLKKPNSLGPLEPSHGMEIGKLLLSLLHSWGIDKDLDKVCQVKLGLLRPMVPQIINFILYNLDIKSISDYSY